MTTKTRDISDLLDANGDVKSTHLDNVPDSTNASALASGTLPDGRLSSNVTQNSATQTLTNKTINASNNTLSNVPNSALTNSSITINGSATALGTSITVATTDASTLVSGTLNNSRLSSVPNSALANSSITVNGQSISLGGSATVGTNWQSSFKTSNFTAVAGQGFFIDTTSNTVTMTLPSSPSVGDTIEIEDIKGNFSTNNFIVASSNKIEGIDFNKVLKTSRGSAKFVYSGVTEGWAMIQYNILETPPSLTNISGSIFSGDAGNLVLTGARFGTANLVVRFVQVADSIDTTVTVTPSSTTEATVAIPSAVYNNATFGNLVSISVTNSDSNSSGALTTQVKGLPSGGTVTTSGVYRIHTFTSSGTFVNPINPLSVEYLVIAGGGSSSRGANATGTGGGGAGGYRSNVSGQSSGGGGSAESSMSLSSGSKTVTIGAGGAPQSSNGADSVFDTITSIGGGRGGGFNVTSVGSGGSGGGGAYQSGSYGSGTTGQGYRGGNHTTGGGGGGGGASEVGDDSNSNGRGGDGGDGVSSNINGSSVTRAGGGGGGAHPGYTGYATNSNGGSGGGGYGGGNSSGGSGSGNTGGGAGGTIGNGSQGGNSGGSGIVIIRYDASGL